MTSNLLLDPDKVANFTVDFNTLTANDFREAFDFLVPKMQAEFQACCANRFPTFLTFTDSPNTEHLEGVLGILSTLTGLARNDELDELERNEVTKIYALFGEQGRSKQLYDRLVQFQASEEYKTLPYIKRLLIDECVSGMELSGVALPEQAKKQLKKLSIKAGALSSKFGSNLTKSAVRIRAKFKKAELEGVPARVLGNMEHNGKGSYVATYYNGLDEIEMYAVNPNTREKAYNAGLLHGQRPGCDNRKIAQHIADIRHKMAAILNNDDPASTYAQISLRKKMAKTPERVSEFLQGLLKQVRPAAKAFVDEQERLGAEILGRPVEFHDRAFVHRLIKEKQYQLDTELVRSYFDYETVRDGLFTVVQKLFGVSFVRFSSDWTLWDESVECYNVYANSELIGTLYLDAFARDNKSGGAWMSGVVSRSVSEDHLDLPQAIIVCNFTRETPRTTLPFREVETLFHEMGHALHHLLTKIDILMFSGIHHVEWDAVELPSQMMENFAWDYETIKMLTSYNPHCEDHMPRDLYDKMVAARHFGAASSLIGNIKYALIDLSIFSNSEAVVSEVEEQISQALMLRMYDARSEIAPTFSHIFDGGYAAGYYSYLWAEVMSADAFAAFEEVSKGVSLLDSEEVHKVAQRFKESILEVGGSRSMNESFSQFRGRDPDSSLLLKSYGIVL